MLLNLPVSFCTVQLQSRTNTIKPRFFYKILGSDTIKHMSYCTLRSQPRADAING